MRHYTTKHGTPLTPAHHTGRREVRATAKLRNREPDIVLAFGQDGLLFYGDSPEDYEGAQELSCRNCARFVHGTNIDECACGDHYEPLVDYDACEDWERRQ